MGGFILGISAFYHDSAAALLENGKIIGAVQEERFSRIKHDPGFPGQSISYLLSEAGIEPSHLTFISFYDKPFIKLERILETALSFAPRGLTGFASAMPVWMKEKLFIKKRIKDELKKLQSSRIRAFPEMVFPEHHLSHAASAFFPSPFEKAAILTLDGVGEWATTTIGYGEKNRITCLRELYFPHSPGLLYSSFTRFCGFRVNSGEYKLMGLAPYGNRDSATYRRVGQKIRDVLVDLRKDGSFLLNMDYFDFVYGRSMYNRKKWEALFMMNQAKMDTFPDQARADMALAVQDFLEEVMLFMAKTAKTLTCAKYLVLAGGVALNCTAAGRLLREKIFDRIWIQPASSDAGAALGAAYAAHHLFQNNSRPEKKFSHPGRVQISGVQPEDAEPVFMEEKPGKSVCLHPRDQDSMNGGYFGPEYGEKDIRKMIVRNRASSTRFSGMDFLCRKTAELLSQGAVVGWFQGRMEFGPRALGNRSILADPRDPEMRLRVNRKIKFREEFRPFAPAVLLEDAHLYFDLDQPSPYMLFTAQVHKTLLKTAPQDIRSFDIHKRSLVPLSTIPAVTHVDGSARIQTVDAHTNPLFANLLCAFKEITGCSVLLNTSFNVRNEPIVMNPEDAYQTFMKTGMDYLVMGNHLFEKAMQQKHIRAT